MVAETSHLLLDASSDRIPAQCSLSHCDSQLETPTTRERLHSKSSLTREIFMRYKPLTLCMLATTVLGSGVATSAVLAQPVGMASLSTAHSKSATKATIETITQQIAQLEVERALQQVRYTSDHPSIRAIDSQLRRLRQRLIQLQPNGDQAAASAVSKAIKAKIAELEVDRARQGVKFTTDSPVIQTIDSQLRNLRKRLVQLQPSRN